MQGLAWLGSVELRLFLISSTGQQGPAGSICTNGVRIAGSIPICAISSALFSGLARVLTLDAERGKELAGVPRQGRIKMGGQIPGAGRAHTQANAGWEGKGAR